MCGQSGFELNGMDVFIHLGYGGGKIDINDLKYHHYPRGESSPEEERVQMKEYLKTLSQEVLSEIILQTIENAEED